MKLGEQLRRGSKKAAIKMALSAREKRVANAGGEQAYREQMREQALLQHKNRRKLDKKGEK